MNFFLEFRHGGLLKRIPLKIAKITIGRSADCTLQFEDDPKMSRTHCTISRTEGDIYVLIDENASNGTFLNDTRLGDDALPLENGDKIRAGNVILTFYSEMPSVGRTTQIQSEIEERMRNGAGFQTLFGEIMGKPKKKK